MPFLVFTFLIILNRRTFLRQVKNNYTPLKSPERVPSRPTGRPHRTISAKYVKVYFLTILLAGFLINWQLIYS